MSVNLSTMMKIQGYANLAKEVEKQFMSKILLKKSIN